MCKECNWGFLRFSFCDIAIHAHSFDRHINGFPWRKRDEVLECIQVLRFTFSSLKVGGWSAVKNNETVQLAMLQFAPLYHIIWRSWGDHEDHMIYKQRRRRPAWYEPNSILRTRLSTIKDIPQNFSHLLRDQTSHKDTPKRVSSFYEILMQTLDSG